MLLETGLINLFFKFGGYQNKPLIKFTHAMPFMLNGGFCQRKYYNQV